jgi:transcription-repair coupling factor (superfamily II helicase)
LQKFLSLVFTAEIHESAFTSQSLLPSHKSQTLTCHRVEAFLSDVRRFLARVDEWRQRDYAIAIATRYPERVSDWLRDIPLADMPPIVRLSADDLPIADRINIFPTPLSAGFVLPNERLVVVTDSELFNAPYKPRKKRWKGTAAVKSPSDLREGDYVVHIHHGIGIYRGIVRQEVLGKESDYLVIEYAEGERLYVPVHQIDRVRKYVAVDGGEPPLSSLSNNKRWLRLRQKAKENAEQVAKELLELYARRQIAEGFAFSPDTPWQREMEDAFPFVETEDQLRAIEEVKADMESPRPMNRLVCGDVGFGKTEIAIRAAFKACHGRQAGGDVGSDNCAGASTLPNLHPTPCTLSRQNRHAQQVAIAEGAKGSDQRAADRRHRHRDRNPSVAFRRCEIQRLGLAHH